MSVRSLRKCACRVARPESWVLTLTHRAAMLRIRLSPLMRPFVRVVVLRKSVQPLRGMWTARERAWSELAQEDLPSDLRQFLVVSMVLARVAWVVLKLPSLTARPVAQTSPASARVVLVSRVSALFVLWVSTVLVSLLVRMVAPDVVRVSPMLLTEQVVQEVALGVESRVVLFVGSRSTGERIVVHRLML